MASGSVATPDPAARPLTVASGCPVPSSSFVFVGLLNLHGNRGTGVSPNFLLAGLKQRYLGRQSKYPSLNRPANKLLIIKPSEEIPC